MELEFQVGSSRWSAAVAREPLSDSGGAPQWAEVDCATQTCWISPDCPAESRLDALCKGLLYAWEKWGGVPELTSREARAEWYGGLMGTVIRDLNRQGGLEKLVSLRARRRREAAA